MNFPNIKADTDKIAQGLYAMIKAHPDGDCLRLGMFPAAIMEVFDTALSARIPDTFLNKEDLTAIDGKSIRQEIIHEVCCKILSLATEEGYCIV